MENLEKLYLLFFSQDFYFLAPLSCVRNVADGKTEESSTNVQPAAKYAVFLEQGGKSYLFRADDVLGVRMVEKDRFLVLEPPVLNEKNRYLQAVVPMQEAEEQTILAYALNFEYLAKNEDLWNI